MLVDFSATKDTIGELNKLPFQIYLGGSRRMADRFSVEHLPVCEELLAYPTFNISVTEDTDYDFYATYHKGLEESLIDLGFVLSPANEYYLDSECVKIYCKDNIQIVLRYDAELYKTVFDNINLEVYYTYLWKSSPTQPNRDMIGPFFNMLFDIARAFKGE